MKKLGQEIKYDTDLTYLKAEIKLLKSKKDKLDPAKVAKLKQKFKDIDRTINKISQIFAEKRTINRSEAEKKTNQYRKQVRDLQKELNRTEEDFMKKQLFGGAGNSVQMSTMGGQGVHVQNKKLMNEMGDQLVTIEREMVGVLDTVKNTKDEVFEQGRKIEDMDGLADDIESEMSMIEQFMKVIVNRNLLTKIMLILLIIFLGLADLAVIIMKIL